MSKFARLKEKIKTYGYEYIIGAIAARLPEWLFSYYHTVLISSRNPKMVTRNYKEYNVRAATPDDAPRLGAVDISPEKALERLKHGDSCFIVEKGEDVVAISWGATGRMWIRYGGQIVDMEHDGFFLYGVYILPEERMKGFIGPLFKKQFELYAKQDRDHALGAVDIFNKPSIMLHRRMGFDIVGETYGITLLGVTICYYKKWPSLHKKFHIYISRPPENLHWV